jgi:hypothetical protein
MGVIAVIVYVAVAWVGLAVVTIGVLNLAKWGVRSTARASDVLPSPAFRTPPRPLPAPTLPRTGGGTLQTGIAPRSMSGSARSSG